MTENDICTELSSAMENDEIQVYYQPQYDAVTGKLRSAEALARWIKPDGKMIMPGDFIPPAEKTGLINELDFYILRKVCAFLRKRLDSGKRTVPAAVNFSRRHLDDDDFCQKLYDTADSFDIPHKLLEVEITESAMTDRSDRLISLTEELRQNGFSVAIDDFGSGLSSLSLVKDISADILKIDKSLLSGNCENDKERIVLESIFLFAGRLGMKTVAEGVETGAQLGFLRTCSCSLIQGFLFAKPQSEESFEKALDENIIENDTDILSAQSGAAATQLLLQAVFMKYPLTIMANLTRNSFYMMGYDNFTSTSCPASGDFDDLIVHGASTMHPDDRHIFTEAFSREHLLEAHKKGEKFVKAVTRQLGDDNVYRRVETTDYFVSSPSSRDVLVITLCENLE